MSHIYYKGTFEVHPAPFHPLIPTLFIESGKMPCSSSDKAKQCIILVNLAGIYFLRPNKLQKGYKISKFLSSFLITEVTYDENKRTISTKNDSSYIQCPHMDEAVVQLVSARKYLLSKYYERSPVKFNGFPTPPAIEALNFEGVKLLPLQYVCYCAQHFERPDENGILLLFKKFNPLHHSIFGLDLYCKPPNHLNCLCGPLHLLDSISTLFFNGFAPYCACRIIHKIMKHQSAIRTFILDGYKTLVPEQLRLKKLSPRSLISIAIQNCRIPEEQMIKLFVEFGEFAGEIQRLTLKNIELTDKSWNELVNAMTNCRSFRTIEVFELEKIDLINLTEAEIKDDILRICKHCRFIQKFSLSMWTPAQPLSNIKPFLVTTFLYKISLQGQNLTEPFPDSIKLPNLLVSLDFSHSSFSYSSMKSLFLLLSKTPEHTPISLNIADIDMPSPQWNQFYQEFSKLSQPTYISELDWSGNPIRSVFVDSFTSFFFAMSPIKFLSIDRVFKTESFDDFKKFIRSIPKGKLKGLSIGGSAENNFCGGFPQLFDEIATICPLNIIHLIGQKLKVNDMHALFDFLSKNSSSIWEIFIDDTNLQEPMEFLNFYKKLFTLSIPIIGRPEIDLERLFGPKNQIDQSTRDELNKFKEGIARVPNVPSRICRSYFFSRRDTQKGLEFKDYAVVIHKFPLVFFNSNDIDRYQIQYRMQRPLPSLIPNLAKTKVMIRSLSDLHATTLLDPSREPRYEDPGVCIINRKDTVISSDNSNNQAINQLPEVNVQQTQIQQDTINQQYVQQDSQNQQYVQQDSQNQQYVQQDSQNQQYVNQEGQYQQYGVQDNQYQQYGNQDYQYQQYGNQEGQYQQYGNQDYQYQQYGNQDGQYQQYGNQDYQYQQYGGQNDQYQQYGNYDQYGNYNNQYQQYGGQEGQYQQYGVQDNQYQQYGNIPLNGQSPESSIDLMYSPQASNQQFYPPDETTNQQFYSPNANPPQDNV